MSEALYVPPEIWEYILKFVKPDIKVCKECNHKVCMNCECDTGHESCSKCTKMYCLFSKRSALKKCAACSSRICLQCGLHYRRANTDFQTFSFTKRICFDCVGIEGIQAYFIADNKQICVCSSCVENCPQLLRPLMPNGPLFG